jgi:hypothetical protein
MDTLTVNCKVLNVKIKIFVNGDSHGGDECVGEGVFLEYRSCLDLKCFY